MAITINCTWCNKTMGSVKSIDKLKEWDQGEICKGCLDKKANVEKSLGSVVDRTKKKAELLRDEAFAMLEKEIKAIAGGA